MVFMNWIMGRFNDAYTYFYQLYVQASSWAWPMNQSATWFYSLANLFYNLWWDFYYFDQWVDSTANKLLEILNWNTIKSYITNWQYYLGDLTTIFYYFWTNVTNVITSWWTTAQATVKVWIETAKSFLQSQINTINTWLTSLQASVQSWLNALPSWNEVWTWFKDWLGKVLTAIRSWGFLTGSEEDAIMETKFTERKGFWEGWQDMRDTVINFFANPLGWLEAKFTDWFLGGE